MHQKPEIIHLAVANMPLYEMLRPPVCSCSIPGECETSEDNVLEVGNVKNDKDDNFSSVRLYDLEQANVLFQILISITKEEDCAQACGEFNLCTNYTFLGPQNPLR